ncbi:hypothetical protein M758_4G076100 [Ceratodon purpureus]|nr:hypothetical protein M758_4G076100 [Ceratodon purpureus]
MIRCYKYQPKHLKYNQTAKSIGGDDINVTATNKKKISEGESYVDIGCQGERVEVWIGGQGLRIGVVFDVY